MAPKKLVFAWRVLHLLGRVFLAAAAACTLAVALALYAFWRAVDVERVRSGIESALSSAFHSRATVKGLLLSPLGLKLRGLRIEAPDGGLPILESRSALLTLRIPALFTKRRLELSSLFLYSPSLRWSLPWSGFYGLGSGAPRDNAARGTADAVPRAALSLGAPEPRP